MKIFVLLLSLVVGLITQGCANAPNYEAEAAELALHDRRNSQVIAIDKTIEADIIAELNAQALGFDNHVSVNAYNRAVLVTGEVVNAELSKKIIDIVSTTKNVKLVHDHLVIAFPSAPEARRQDAMTTKSVRSALNQIVTTPGFESNMVKVVTENAVVYLLGQVYRNEGDIVINLTRHQPNVIQIVTIFEYLD